MADVQTVQFTGGNNYANNPAMAPKITEWSNEPSVRDLKEDLEASKQGHDNHVLNVQRWRDLMAAKGKFRAQSVKGRSEVQPRLIRRQAEWRYSALTEPFLGSDKLFSVEPVTFEDEASAKQNELVLNWQFRTKLNRVRFIDEFVRTNVDEGSAVVRIGWCRQTKKITEEVAVYTFIAPEQEQEVQQLEDAISLRDTNPRSYEEDVPEEIRAAVDFYDETGQPNIAIKTGTKSVQTEKIIDNRPTLELIAPENVYIDPSCGGDIDKAMFVVVSFETSKADLLREGDKYKNLDYVNWENASILATPDHETHTPQTFNFKDTLRKRIVAYEYWGYYDVNGDDNLVPIVATWIGDTLVRMEENPFPDKKPPFVVTNYMPIKRELMGEPDAELLQENQAILGALTRGMIDLMGRSANSQQGMPKGMLDIINRRRFDKGQDYEYNPQQGNPEQQIIAHKYPEIPTSAYNMLQLQNQEAESLTGVKSFAGGMSGEAYGDVAAGIRGVLDASSKREMAILRRLAKGISDIGIKFIAMNAEFMSEKEVIRITNNKFVTIKREELAGNFDLVVDISTAEVDNQKAQDLGFMLQTIGPNAGTEIVMMILADICELKRMPALAERLRQFKPTPDPLVEKAKELEVLKLQKEIEKIQSEIDKNKAETVKKSAEADKVNLDVVEQESGTKHERDMEKQKGQAEGNQNLEITKALVKGRKTANGEEPGNVEAAIGWNEMSKRLPNGRDRMPNDIGNIGSFINRNAEAQIDPRLSVNSKYFEPASDPALNPGLRI